MQLNMLVAVTALLATASASFSTFSSRAVFNPDASYRAPQVLYPRTVELGGGVLLATWENYSKEPPLVYAPIYESKDGGETWREIARVQDQKNGWGLRYQPFLYELPQSIGGYPAGTVLLATNSIPSDLSATRIDIYASQDKGHTWKFVSHVASGGAAVPDNGVPAIWEPFLLVYGGQLIVYYSDQRDPKYGQKLVYQASSNLVNWGGVVDVVVHTPYTARPGMVTIAKLPNGQYMMTYEYGGGPLASGGTSYKFPVYYRLNGNPLAFKDSKDYALVTDKGIQPLGTPTIAWSSVGGAQGTILVSSGDRTEVFANRALGSVGGWKSFQTPQGAAYSRHLRVFKGNPNHLLIMGGGVPSQSHGTISDSVIDITKSLAGAI